MARHGRGKKDKRRRDAMRKEGRERKEGKKETAGKQVRLKGRKFRWQFVYEITKEEMKLCHCGRYRKEKEKDDVGKAVCDTFVFQKATENIQVK